MEGAPAKEGSLHNAAILFLNPYPIPLHHVMLVEMADGKSADFTMDPVEVVGHFSINVVKDDRGEAVVVFKIVADAVVRVELRDGYPRPIFYGC